MAYAQGALNGAGPFYVSVNSWLVSQNGPANLSTFYYEVGIFSTGGWPTWSTNTQWWWLMRSDGWNPGGTFTIDFRSRNSYIVGNGYYDMGHNPSTGYLSSFWVRGDINTDHGSVGDGSTDLAWLDAPRIAKRPNPVGAPTIDEVTDDSFRVNFSYDNPADWNGGTPEFFLVRWSSTTPADTPGTYGESSTSGSPFTISGPEMGIFPGNRYYVTVYAKNNATYDNGGYSLKSADTPVDTLAGIYVSDGVNWVPTAMRLSDGSSWASPLPTISDGDSWEAPLEV